MRNLARLVVPLLLGGVALAGCSGSGASGFTIQAPAGGAGPFTFTAAGKADNYTWDLGDRLTVLYGKRVEHAYDFSNGQLTVKLTTRTGDAVETFTKPLTLGSGDNAPPNLVLEGETRWAITGETLRFSGAASDDPDGDPLRYSWNCIRTGDAIRQGAHSHGGAGGVPYGTPSAGSVLSRLAVVPLPAADRAVAGDLCESLGAGGRPSLDATIEGRFEKTGVYDIVMLASDPKTPTTSGRFTLYVTSPAERPAPVQAATFNGTLTAGTDGALQPTCALAGQACDQAQHPFSLPLAGIATFVNVTYDAGPAAGTPAAALLTVALKRGENVQSEPKSESFVLTGLPAAGYTLDVVLRQGVAVEYRITVTTHLNMDPTQVY